MPRCSLGPGQRTGWGQGQPEKPPGRPLGTPPLLSLLASRGHGCRRTRQNHAWCARGCGRGCGATLGPAHLASWETSPARGQGLAVTLSVTRMVWAQGKYVTASRPNFSLPCTSPSRDALQRAACLEGLLLTPGRQNRQMAAGTGTAEAARTGPIGRECPSDPGLA